MQLAKKNRNVNLVLNQLKNFSAWSRNRFYYGPKGLESQILTFSQKQKQKPHQLSNGQKLSKDRTHLKS